MSLLSDCAVPGVKPDVRGVKIPTLPSAIIMGLLSWWKGRKSNTEAKPIDNSNATATATATKTTEAPGMNGALEVPRPPNFSVFVFEFGSVAASADKVTLAGYCPVSEELEPCRWEILPANASNAPQFRIVFG